MTTTTPESLICVESHHHGDRFYKEGELYDASDPDVLSHIEWFTHPLTPRLQWIQPGWQALDAERHRKDMERQAEARRIFEAQAAENVVRIPPPDLMKCKTDHVATLNGRAATVKRGSVVPVDHELVAQNPDLWRAV